jgi:hypothetical protein
MADRAGGEVNGLADLKLVFFQRGSPELQLHGSAPFDGPSPRSRRNIAAKSAIASKIPLLKRPRSAIGSRSMWLYLSSCYRAMLERIIGSAAALMAGMRQHG